MMHKLCNNFFPSPYTQPKFKLTIYDYKIIGWISSVKNLKNILKFKCIKIGWGIKNQILLIYAEKQPNFICEQQTSHM